LGELECAVGTVPHIGGTRAEHTGWSADGRAMRKRSPAGHAGSWQKVPSCVRWRTNGLPDRAYCSCCFSWLLRPPIR